MSLILSGTNGLSDVDGSAATPAIRGTDTNTGIFFPAADTVGISTGGTERARVDSSGNLGLGVTPSAWFTSNNLKALQFGGGSVVSYLNNQVWLASNYFLNSSGQDTYVGTGPANRLIMDGAYKFFTAASGTAGNAITFTQAMTLDASGNLGVGTTSPGNRLQVVGATGPVANFVGNNANNFITVSDNNNTDTISVGAIGGGNAYLYSGSGKYTALYAGAAERARIDSSGTWLVGRTAASDTTLGFQVDSAGRVNAAISTDNSYLLYSTAASAYRFYVTNGGQINATSTSITAISDQSLKENIRDIDTGLSQVLALRPRRFDWKEETAIGEKDVAGFIAQEVEEVLPELVYEYQYSEGVTKKSLKMGDILPTLVKAIQEQQAIITALTARIEALEQ